MMVPFRRKIFVTILRPQRVGFTLIFPDGYFRISLMDDIKPSSMAKIIMGKQPTLGAFKVFAKMKQTVANI